MKRGSEHPTKILVESHLLPVAKRKKERKKEEEKKKGQMVKLRNSKKSDWTVFVSLRYQLT